MNLQVRTPVKLRRGRSTIICSCVVPVREARPSCSEKVRPWDASSQEVQMLYPAKRLVPTVFDGRRLSRIAIAAFGFVVTCVLALSALAEEDSANAPPDGTPDPSIATSLPEPLKSFGGLRPALAAHGVTFQLNYIGDTLGNFNGGFRQGATYNGRFELVIDTDLEKAIGWKGATIHANMFQIHGVGLARHNIGNIFTPSNIEALPATRLYEAWFEQKLLDEKVAVRIGQQGADQESFTTTSGGLYINNTFGWPGVFSTDLPSGGPNYPLATPAARIKVDASPNLAVLAAIFNGDPAGPGPGEPQQRDPAGLNFRLRDPPLAIAEAQFKYGRDANGEGLGGTIKIGSWHHFGRFADQRFGSDLLSLADPNSNGQPLFHRGNSAVYATVEQQIYRPPGADAATGITVFARAAASPFDRNFAGWYVDGGVNFTG
ncbi:MAG: carbohydrate porin, partial [Methylobacteriaceae bacterium]|nr:carbohydrate porin [Methylobacteriaceae bacterium]